MACPIHKTLRLPGQVEDDIRAAGAVPATIAVMDGTLHIGLDPEQLTALAQAKGVAKLSRADMAVCIATGGTGATTVAATMIAAHLAGIAVFATGGIGGVHKGAEDSFDISADLMELAQTPVTVVAAGGQGHSGRAQNAGGFGNSRGASDRSGAKTAFPRSGARHHPCPRPCGWMRPRRSPAPTGCAAQWACPVGS